MSAEQRDRIFRIMTDVAVSDVTAALIADGVGAPPADLTAKMRQNLRRITKQMPTTDVARLSAMTDVEMTKHFRDIGKRGLALVRPS